MDFYDNIETFFNNETKIEPVDMDFAKLFLFTSLTKIERRVVNRRVFAGKQSSIENFGNEYVFCYKGKRYNFSVFSDRELQKCDRKILKHAKLRKKRRLLRVLKLACSMDLIDVKVIVGKSALGNFELLISYQENGGSKVIDYGTNLVMKKEDYYELFKFSEFNILDKMDLYNVYFLINELENYKDIGYYLLFSKEIINDMGRNFSYLVNKYDKSGINLHNYLLFGDNCDSLFGLREDAEGAKYKKLQDEIDKFTLEPQKSKRHIKYNNIDKKYQLRDMRFGSFTFDLLSDMINDDEIKHELLSDERYRKCHINSIMIANSLKDKDKEFAYVVGGRAKWNEIDYYYHSWVEIENGKDGIVIDFNHNIIMNRKKYYKLYEAQPISKTHIFEMNEVIQTVINDALFDIHSMELNYFGKEMMNDLKRNEKVLKRKINN